MRIAYLCEWHEVVLVVNVTYGVVRLALGPAWLLPDAGGVSEHRARAPILGPQGSHYKSRICRESRRPSSLHETSPELRESRAPNMSHETWARFRAKSALLRFMACICGFGVVGSHSPQLCWGCVASEV